MICLPRPDMEHCIKIGKFGMKLPRVINSVKEGDRVACYVSKEARVIALGKAVRPYYKGKAAVFLANGMFEHRFDFSAEVLKNEVDFRALTSRLKLTRGSNSWGPVLRLGLVRLADDDFDLIVKEAAALRKAGQKA